MYYPFIRGKQFELVMLREMAPRIAQWGFVPIIEPVKGNFPALKRALDELIEHNSRFILIANPRVGDLKQDSSSLWDEIFSDHLLDRGDYSAGLNLTATETLDDAKAFFDKAGCPTAVIHDGFSDGKGLSALIANDKPQITAHVFVESDSPILYRRYFKGVTRVIVEDGFKSQSNRDYPPSELFSELYLVYSDLGFEAFGDFLIVGREFKETGGPAYAIAIHLTYVDPNADDVISVKHYVSDQVDTPKDPAGKFLEALDKLVEDVNSPKSLIFRTSAVEEYLSLHRAGHFPGLGYVKKLSMQHHIELMANLLVGRA